MKQKWLTLLHDRLLWFVILGLVLFAIERVSQQRTHQTILIDLPLVEKLVAQWEGQTKRSPNAQELDALIEGYIREEILVREAIRLGLDDNDVIIRRRLAQKVEFFLRENDPPELPDEAVLRDWFETNRVLYDTPPKLGWRHVFAMREAEAAKLLTQLRKNDNNWRGLGQPFMLNRAYTRHDELTLARLMGHEFAAALFGTTETGWFGPLRSAYGWHLVVIDKYEAAQGAQFERLAEKVARDWQDEAARMAHAEAWRKLRASYEIELLPVKAD